MTQFDLRRQDCIKGMSRLADDSVDLVVTSPPYNLGIRYGKFSDTQDRESYLNWCGEWAEQIRRVLKSSGSFFLNIGSAPSNPMLPHEIVMTLRGSFVLQNTIHWIKSIAIDDRCSRRPAGDATRTQQTHRTALSTGKRLQQFASVISNRSVRNGFLTIATNTFFISRRPDVSNSIGSPSVFLIRTKATLRAGRTLAEAICVVAATLGLFRMKQFRVARKSDRILRHFQFNSRSGASNCTAQARDASKRCLIHFSASEIQPSRRSAAA